MITKIKPILHQPYHNFSITFRLIFNATSSKPISYYYKLLNVKPGFTQEQLKTAYLQMVKKHHPDLSKQPNAKQMFMEVQIAYQILQEQSKGKKQKRSYNNVKEQNEHNNDYQDLEDAAYKFRQKFYDKYKKKQSVDEAMQFSYNLYKKHYEQMQQKKMEYRKYQGHQGQIWARKDQKGQPMWGRIGVGAAMLGLISGAIYFVNLK